MQQVSPRFTSEKLASGRLEDKIDIFEDRLRGWFLAPARRLLDDDNGAFAALHVLLAYFEAHAIYSRGEDSKNRSKQFFIEALVQVLGLHKGDSPLPPFLTEVGERLYDGVRCGLFHDGMIRHGVLVRRGGQPLVVAVSQDWKIQGIILDVDSFTHSIERHLDDYLAQLRDPKNIQLRENFAKAWTLKDTPPPANAVND